MVVYVWLVVAPKIEIHVLVNFLSVGYLSSFEYKPCVGH